MRKWKRLFGLKLKRNEEEEEEDAGGGGGEGGEEKLKRHGGGGGRRVRRVRILRSGCGVGYEMHGPVEGIEEVVP